MLGVCLFKQTRRSDMKSSLSLKERKKKKDFIEKKKKKRKKEEKGFIYKT